MSIDNPEEFSTQLCKLKTGFSVFSFKGDEVTKRISDPNGYEPELVFFMNKYLPNISDAICFDVGANVGIHAIQMANVSGKVYSFEPIPFIYRLLNENVSLNKISNIVLFNKALSNFKGESKIHLNLEGNFGASSIDNSTLKFRETDINVTTGDSIIASENIPHVDFIKIDVEGHEAKVCQGLTKTIRRFQPVIAMEWNSSQTRDDFNDLNLFGSLFGNYVKFSLTDTHLNFHLKSRNEIKYRFFRKILRPIYKIFTKKVICLGDFYYHENYGNLLLVPKDKINNIKNILNR